MTAPNPPYKNLNLMPRSPTSGEKSGIYLDKPRLPGGDAIALLFTQHSFLGTVSVTIHQFTDDGWLSVSFLLYRDFKKPLKSNLGMWIY
ncbi:hypothetical protein [Nostoc sp.]|uniref:hypothetical protein n=1 Tax=Nostoc sp. TaxID=1180 RepID=UPI002FFA3F17